MIFAYYTDVNGKIMDVQNVSDFRREIVQESIEQLNHDLKAKETGCTAYIAEFSENSLEAYLFTLANERQLYLNKRISDVLDVLDNARSFLESLKTAEIMIG